MRPIDGDALDSKIESHYKHKKIDRYDHDLLGHYIDVEMAPTIDAVPVVRCGMCKHWTACESEENDCDIYGVCNQIGRLTIYDWFCADGERR